MKVEKTNSGYEIINEETDLGIIRLVEQSTASFWGKKPGHAALWIGQDHLLFKDKIIELIEHLQAWVETGSFIVNIDLELKIKDFENVS